MVNAGYIKGSLALLALAVSTVQTQDTGKCSVLQRQLSRLGCTGIARGPQGDPKCQRKVYTLCKRNCTDTKSDNEACSALSGFEWSCADLQHKWSKLGCTEEGAQLRGRCKNLKRRLDSKSCSVDSSILSDTDERDVGPRCTWRDKPEFMGDGNKIRGKLMEEDGSHPASMQRCRQLCDDWEDCIAVDFAMHLHIGVCQYFRVLPYTMSNKGANFSAKVCVQAPYWTLNSKPRQHNEHVVIVRGPARLQVTSCPDGYGAVENICLRVSSEKANFTEAEAACQRDGGSRYVSYTSSQDTRSFVAWLIHDGEKYWGSAGNFNKCEAYYKTVMLRLKTTDCSERLAFVCQHDAW